MKRHKSINQCTLPEIREKSVMHRIPACLPAYRRERRRERVQGRCERHKGSMIVVLLILPSTHLVLPIISNLHIDIQITRRHHYCRFCLKSSKLASARVTSQFSHNRERECVCVEGEGRKDGGILKQRQRPKTCSRYVLAMEAIYPPKRVQNHLVRATLLACTADRPCYLPTYILMQDR